MAGTTHCPECGSPLVEEDGWSEELCPHCLLQLALEESSGEELAATEAGPSVDSGSEALARGTILGNRYGIRSLLGRGGMGEVWRAFDLKLRVDVALKTVRPDLAEQDRVLQTLRQEVRAAREVVSPNVCRVYDLQELAGRELVSMEYVDGTTLLEVLSKQGPLELQKAREIAAQFLAGLDAIHQAGLVHRDIKPENIMITSTGRVVVMDFGIAKGLAAAGTGTVAGTPAYMAPEQGRGEAVNARADVFSAGVVLAEMLAPEIGTGRAARQALWQGVREEPPQLPDSPWRGVLSTAVAYRPGQRYASASALARALEEVITRVEGAEDVRPFPGLVAFSETDREYFFGRELEAEALWKKIRRLSMLALIGPSGAGKTSFLRAGLLATEPSGWAHVVCTPGEAPSTALRQALAPQLSGDSDAIRELVKVEDPEAMVSAVSRWRGRSRRALLVVDQFEELFTLNPRDVQTQFAELLGRLTIDADIKVLLSMRDDFLFNCHAHEPLRAVFSELTLLGPPTGTALRRAVVQPALKCGYRFSDEALVDEMLAEVEGERAALPLVAFAAEQLWQRRDRDQGLLTREAYEVIGGVGGALAQHAELTLERIGVDRTPVVRELFRNLVTAQGSRAVRDREELLSVFGGEARSGSPGAKPPGYGASGQGVGAGLTAARETASEVLDALIDARLLTSYGVEAAEGSGEATQQVEIVHESLLTAWPRLVRWTAQDVEGAELRDELRQAARRWQERDRPDDLLWTGSAFSEYQVWRERYPGRLSEIEEEFATAMASYATRWRRRRRLVVTAGFAVLFAGLAIVASFWQRSVREARRAEAANLFSVAQLELEEHPTVAIAYGIASLEQADNPEVRRLALEALWRGPTETRLEARGPMSLSIGPDGRWLATAGPDNGYVLWPSDGGPPRTLEGSDVAMELRVSPRGDLVAGTMDKERQELGLWSFPEGRFLRSFSLGDQGSTWFFSFSPDGERLFTSTEIPAGEVGELEVRSWPVAGGAPDLLAHLDLPAASLPTGSGIDPTGSRLCWADGREIRIARLDGTTPLLASATSVEHERTVASLTVGEQGRQLATADRGGEIRIWSLEHDPPGLTHTFQGPGGAHATAILFDPSGSMLAQLGGFLWDLTAAPDAGPLRLRTSELFNHGLAFDPESRWLAMAHRRSVSLWCLAHPFPQVLRGHEEALIDVRFSPDGTRLVSGAEDGSVRIWPLTGSSGERPRILHQAEGAFDVPLRLAMAPNGSFVVAGSKMGNVRVLPLDGGSVRELHGFTDVISPLAVGPQSRLVAAGGGVSNRKEALVRVWDLESDEVRVLDSGDGHEIKRLDFTADGDLWVHSGPKLRRWSVDAGTPRVVEEIDLESPEFRGAALHDFDPDSRQVLVCDRRIPWTERKPWIQNIDTFESRQLSGHGLHYWWCGLFHAGGEIVVSVDEPGGVRVGPATGEEPHLLLRHEGGVAHVTVSPDGRWIATGGGDKTIRLWPMPDLSTVPLHTLPREELIAKLKTFTNLRAVPDEVSPTGWKIEVGPFPGWETVPTW